MASELKKRYSSCKKMQDLFSNTVNFAWSSFRPV